ncbi:hypothetical protein HC031_28995 [Planosporangium thailandense]|uniref:Secreted protein n=1 Tax=Planosporangium thailandense TaxID=765197 RepID=A0ABX0Y5N4_9ACTN|nr:hypothetical protein [Planosporangium thailandense]NJC73725.1 hypothetical protein [Planosporangium thailandense]
MLIYVGIPVLVVVVVFGLVFAASDRRGHSKRYRPGRPYEFRPVWFLSSPEMLAGPGAEGHTALPGAHEHKALPAGASDAAAERTARTPAEQRATGGASDRW